MKIPNSLSDYIAARQMEGATEVHAESILPLIVEAFDLVLEPKWNPCGAYPLPHTHSSDYSGCLEYKSNAHCLEEDSPSLIFQSHYGMGGEAAFLFHPQPSQLWDLVEVETLIDNLCKLEDYPTLDDGHASELEWEARQDAWVTDGQSDTAAALERLLEGVCPPRHEVRAEALVEWASEQDWFGEALYEWQHVEYVSVWTDGDVLAQAILDKIEGEDEENRPELFALAAWADQTSPEFDTASAFNTRVSMWNNENFRTLGQEEPR